MPTLEDAIALAVRHHAGQKDKAGEPYILHPLRVMMSFSTERERVVAVLHDIVEDTEATLNYLLHQGYDEEIVQAVDRLTRRSNEPYDVFIKRISSNPLANRIKLADLKDNMDLSRLKNITEKDTRRQDKYAAAVLFLSSAGKRKIAT